MVQLKQRITKMKVQIAFVGTISLLVLMCGCVTAPTGDTMSHYHVQMSSLELSQIRAISRHEEVARCLELANEQNRYTQAEIAQHDIEWIESGPDGTELMQALLASDGSAFLAASADGNTKWIEVFLIDSKGCIAATNLRTSDYYQGDEAKWQKVTGESPMDYYVDDIGYDESTRRYLHHYSVPIHDQSGQLSGVLVVGLTE